MQRTAKNDDTATATCNEACKQIAEIYNWFTKGLRPLSRSMRASVVHRAVNGR